MLICLICGLILGAVAGIVGTLMYSIEQKKNCITATVARERRDVAYAKEVEEKIKKIKADIYKLTDESCVWTEIDFSYREGFRNDVSSHFEKLGFKVTNKERESTQYKKDNGEFYKNYSLKIAW